MSSEVDSEASSTCYDHDLLPPRVVPVLSAHMISCLHYPIWIHGFPHNALLDTGVGVKVIHPRVVSTFHLQPHVGSLYVVTAGGLTFNLQAFYIVPVVIAGVDLKVPCYALDIPVHSGHADTILWSIGTKKGAFPPLPSLLTPSTPFP
jgi:hypothetical protein